MTLRTHPKRILSATVGALLLTTLLPSAAHATEPTDPGLRSALARAAIPTAPCDPDGTTSADEDLALELRDVVGGHYIGVIDAYQVSCARMVVTAVRQRDMPRRAAVIAIATTIVEANIRNYSLRVDLTSLGLFQQLDSWGSEAQRLNPIWATNAFLDKMVREYPGNSWLDRPVGEVAQRVQVSAFPDRYQTQAGHADKIVDAVWDYATDHRPASVSGDARADLLVHGHDGQIGLRVGTGNGFRDEGRITGGWGLWVTGEGDDLGRLHFADVNGDGKKDLIQNAKNGEIHVRRGTGGAFGAPDKVSEGWGLWVTGEGNNLGRLHFADVNGDGKADLIQNGRNGEIAVRRGTGGSFGTPETVSFGWGLWVTGKGNNLGVLHFADVTGDGKADLVENGKNGQLNARRGTGTSFGAPDQLSTGWGRWVNGDDLGRLYFA